MATQPLTTTPPSERPTPAAALDSLCSEINTRIKRRLASEGAPKPQHVCRASGIERCGRAMQLQILKWDQREPFDDWLLARFERGRAIESKIVIPRLYELGLEILGGQYPLAIKSHDGKRVICTGHLDFRVRWQGYDVISDCKSMHPNIFGKIRDGRDGVEDLLRDRFAYRYLWQLLLYMYQHDEPAGLFLIDDCLGHWKLVPVLLNEHLDLCEEALTRCEQVMDAVASDSLLPFHEDAAVCRDCWAFKSGACAPPLDFSGDGVRVLGDSLLQELLERMEEIGPVGSEYARLDRTVKAKMKTRGKGMFLCGDFVLENKVGETTRYPLPDEAKKLYATKTPTVKTTWKRVGGA